jgi:hypothetical protein
VRADLDRAIDATPDINVVKAFTRVTMGLCQGRNCQRAGRRPDRRPARTVDRRPSGRDGARTGQARAAGRNRRRRGRGSGLSV